MTREEAIRILDPETSREALGEYEDEVDRLAAALEACKMAAAALRSQQAPVKLDRSRWEGCSACASKCCELCVYQNFGGDDWPCNVCRDGFTAYKPVNYCSVCGRPLTEEAWAELERRINGNNEP